MEHLNTGSGSRGHAAPPSSPPPKKRRERGKPVVPAVDNESALGENGEKFRFLFDNSPDPVVLIDGETYIDCNAAALRLIGLTRKDQLIGLSPWDIAPEHQPCGRPSREMARELNELTLRRGTNRFEFVRRTSDGRDIWIEVSQTVIPFGGRPILHTVWRDIDGRKKAEEARKTSEGLYEAVFEHSVAALAIIEEDGTIGLANTQLCKTLGYSREELEGKMKWQALVAGDREELEARHRARMADPATGPAEFECRVNRKDGTIMLGLIRVGTIPGTKRSIFSGIDITDRKRAEEALKRSESRFKDTFETSAIGMALVSLEGRFLRVNGALCLSLGYTGEELLAKTLSEITHPDDLENDREHARRLVKDDISDYRIEKRYRHRDGYAIWALLTVSIVRDPLGYPRYFVSQIEDITERKLLQEKLQAMALTDDLTGLYNRRGFSELAGEQIRLASRRQERMLLLFVDLDYMKHINDTLGHQEGDRTLIHAARVLKDTFRESDLVARIGGDEFAVLAVGVTEGAEAAILSRLHGNVEKFNKAHRDIPLSFSVGTSRYEPDQPRPLEVLMTEADGCMYEVKREKKSMPPRLVYQGSGEKSPERGVHAV